MAIPFRTPRVRFQPALFRALRGYNLKRLVKDSLAGVVVGIVALPLAMAFAIGSGVPPETGLYTAIIAGFIISALGGSRTQIGGPTGAFVAIVYGIVLQYGVEKLVLCTMMAGVILLIMGVTGIGRMIKFIPYPVTMGFTSGIAVVILSGQFKDLLGLPLESLPPDFLGKCGIYLQHIGQLHWPTALLGVATVAFLFTWPRAWSRRIPPSVIALIGVSLICALAGLPVTTINDRFGGIPQSLPGFQWPEFDWALLRELMLPATTIALLGAIESLLSAVVADGMTDDRHDSNQELMAQGIANIVSPLFGGMPATGAIARTASNIRNGATSPVAGLVHALTLLAVILLAAPLAGSIPLVALSAILVFVAWNMGEWDQFRRLGSIPRSDAAVFLTTFGLTVLVDLTVAVEVGMILAAILFIKRVSELSQVHALSPAPESGQVPDRNFWVSQLPSGVEVFRIQGAFFFGTADKLETVLDRARQETHALILVLDQAMDIDGTGLNALKGLHERLARRGKRLILCGVRPHVRAVLEKSGLLERIGPHNVGDTLFHAIILAKTLSSDSHS